MPKSWPAAKRDRMNGKLHKQKPDLDNLLKGLLDALYREDSHVASVWAEKRWAPNGYIEVIPLNTADWAAANAAEAA
jgi:Holliday junction resolvase RusA-like endonuclease